MTNWLRPKRRELEQVASEQCRQIAPQRNHRPQRASYSSFVIRHSPFLSVLVLALLLTSCAFTTEAAATVGSQRITVGEYNAGVAQLRAQVGEQDWPTYEAAAQREAIDRLIESHLVRLEARRHNIAVTDAEVDAALRTGLDQAQAANAPGQQREGQLDSLAAGTAQQLRPEINQYGGAALPDTDLVQLVRAELERMQGTLDARSQAFPGTLSGELARSGAGSLAGALAGKGVNVPASRLEPYLDSAARQLVAARADATNQFQQGLAQSGVTSGSGYRRDTQRQLLDQKLQQLYVRPVEAVTVQQLIAPDQQKAQEALDKARAGADFNGLVQQYARDDTKGDLVVNNIGSVVPEFFTEETRQIFPSLAAGSYSNVVPVRAPDGTTAYRFFRINTVERRDPTVTEANELRRLWLNSLRERYTVWENPALHIPERTDQ
jgi:hypothetical protein